MSTSSAAQLAAFALAVVVLVGDDGPAHAKVYYSRKGALAAAFPGATSVEGVDLFLTDADAAAIQKAAGVEFPSRLARAYVGRKADTLLGHAFIDTHPVRTFRQTLLIVVGPAGRVAQVLVLAFHEPPEYLAPKGWIAALKGRSLNADMGIGRGVDGITGATMTARSTVAAVRRALALYRRKVAPKAAKPPTPPAGS